MQKKSWFRYLETLLTYQNFVHEEIKNRLKSRNVRCHSVENLMSSSFLSKNIKVKIHRTIILPVVLCECENWPLILSEDRRLRVFENRMLRNICV